MGSAAAETTAAGGIAQRLLEDLLATSSLEGAAFVLGLAYAVLAVAQNRWCWVAGGLASAIFVYLAAQAKLPMQAALQAYYVGMSVYGWLRWSKQGTATETPGFWPLRAHLVALPVTLVASALAARWLAAETQAAWPFLDSATTFVSLLATFLVARKRIENWLYFLAADAVMVFLFAAQGLVLSAALFCAYLVISIAGFFTWLRSYRSRPQPA